MPVCFDISRYLRDKYFDIMKITDAFAFIGIVIHNHFVLPMSLFVDLTFRLPNREASSEQFSAVLPLQLQKDK